MTMGRSSRFLQKILILVAVCLLGVLQSTFTDTVVWESEPAIGTDPCVLMAKTSVCPYSQSLKPDGAIVAWGHNLYSQTTTPEGNGFVAILAGGYHSLVIDNNKSLLQFKSGFEPNTYILGDARA